MTTYHQVGRRTGVLCEGVALCPTDGEPFVRLGESITYGYCEQDDFEPSAGRPSLSLVQSPHPAALA
ncbi:hypothetical protein [Streptomyces sp. NPDC005303]|uniref:hypothetical protein n=1 Tax=Streptomyces sp. NPDC005303 TaxID=3155713 RepID=UPI0033A73C2B